MNIKLWFTSLRFLVVMTIVTGIVYPLMVTAFAKYFYPQKSAGSLLSSAGKEIGSELIAQGFKSDKYFWPRPSGVDYNPMPSGGSNLGPISQDLLIKVRERRGLGMTDDLLFASGSGLDPHISPLAAYNQVARVAKARGKSEDEIRKLVASHTEARQLGFLGEERVNILKLNMAVDEFIAERR